MKKIFAIALFTFSFSLFTSNAVAQEASIEGANLWGYYMEETVNTDVVQNIGLGAKTDYEVVMKVPSTGVMKDAWIQGLNVPIRTVTCVTNLTVEVLDSDCETILDEKIVDLTTLADLAYTPVTLNKPIQVTRDLYVGMKFTITDVSENGGKYPVLIDPTQTPSEGCLMFYNDKWNDNSGYGAFIMQVYATEMKLDDAVASFSPIESHTMVDSDSTFTFTINTDCDNDLYDLDYAISINGGEEEQRHVELEIPGGYNKKVTLQVPIHSPKEVCTYPVNMRILKVGGMDNALADQVATSTLYNVNRNIDRNVVMEEFTGTGCGNCPRGLAGMKHCNDTFGERFVGIALHRYNSSDPLYLSTWDNDLYFYGAPDCYLDRTTDYDPYFGSTSSERKHIVQDVAERMKAWAPAGVSASAQFNDDYSRVTIDATVDALCDADYKVVFVLTVDSLYNKTWLQSNYYYINMVDDDEEMAKFCADGIYGQQYANCYFNDVAVASSYVSGTNRGGTVSLTANTTKDISYKLNMPTKTAVYNACLDSKFLTYACVLLIDKDGEIANACKVRVDMPVGVQSVASNTSNEIARIYSADGRQVPQMVRGLNIIQYRDGSVKKVLK